MKMFRSKTKSKSSKKIGNELENIVAQMLNQAQIPYSQETTTTSLKTRCKGNVDFKCYNPLAYLECKRFTKLISYKLNSENTDIKWSQIQFLNKARISNAKAGFILREATHQELYYLSIESFIEHYCSNKKNSINLNDLKKIAQVITDLEFLKK